MYPTNQIPFKQHIWWSGAREYFTLLHLKGQTYQTIQGIQRPGGLLFILAQPVPPDAQGRDP